ncbi:TonB-dependent receptor [Flavimarina sp. Hel_I_48]|uniref:TonB-dependent receptor n=1 Tax=Flavimarina sp. Hel_I_48 TaxID=1392488 RepID=UPI0004DF6E7D|nr:TonB-dependent receptor [Flavimarina sp. Hel_I_48]
MNYFKFFAFLFLCWSGKAQQCDFTLSGKVVDFHDGSILVGAVLSIENQQIYEVTDLDGNFVLRGLCAGTAQVTITHPECEVKTFTINVDDHATQNFRLEHHTEELSKVTLKGEKYHSETTSSAEESLKTETLENFSGVSLGDALKEVSGVSSLNTGSTVVKPIIQGLHSSRVLIINNGTRMEDQEWGVEHAPNLDVNTAANVTVVKGAGALRYGGDAVGGVIVTNPAVAPVKDTLFGKTIFGAMSNGRGTSTTSSLTKAYKSGLHFTGQGTLKYFGDREAPDYVLSNTGNREQDFSVGVGLNKFTYGFEAYYSYYHANIGILRASHIGSVGDLVSAINANEPNYVRPFTYDIAAPRQDVSHQLAKINVFKKFENAGKLDLTYSFQLNNRQEYDIRRGDDRDKPSLDLELTTHTVNTNFEWNSNPDFTANFGGEAMYQVNFPNPDTGVRRLIPDYDMYTAAGYATLDYNLSENLVLNAGARYDYIQVNAKKYYQTSRWEERGYDMDFGTIVQQDLGDELYTTPDFQYNNLSATMGAKYTFSDYLTGRINLSSASRAPNPAELFSDGLHHSAAIIELGDLRLNKEQSYKASVSLDGSVGDFSFGLNPFYNRIDDFIILEPDAVEQTTRGAFPVYEYRQVNARLFGIDVNARYRFDQHFDLDGSFSYVNGEDLTRNRPLIDMPAPNWTNTLTYRNEKMNNLTLGLRSQSVFEQKRFPDNDFTVEVLQDNGERVDQTVRVSQPPAGYNLFHFTSSIDFKVAQHSNLTLGLYVDNILDTNYREYLNRQRYYVDDLGRNFRIQLKFNY